MRGFVSCLFLLGGFVLPSAQVVAMGADLIASLKNHSVKSATR